MPTKPGNRRRNRGSGTLGSFAVDLVGALGGQPNPASRKLFESWQRWEGGWSNNAARYNPLNLTAPGSGLPAINSVGVVAMPSYQEGLRRTADLIKSGYPAVAQAIRSGQVDFSNPALQADLNRWLSGKRTPGMTPYVSKIARSYGANVPAGAGSIPGATPTQSPPSPLPQQAPQFQTVFDPAAFRTSVRQGFLTGGGRIDLMGMPGMLQSAYRQVQIPQPQQRPAAPGVETAPPGGEGPQQLPKVTGKGILAPTSFKKTHDTSNLGWPAIDIMGKPGTPLRVPVSGTVIRHGTAQGGEAMYIDTNGDGEGDYWAGHITNMAPVGTKLKAGDVFAYISPDHAAPHLHWAKR